MAETLRVTYELTPDNGEDPETKARDIAYEQTVELPPAAVPPALADTIPGRVGTLTPLAQGRWQVTIDYDASLLAGELTQTLNLLFGNISLKRGIRISRIEWPPSLVGRLGGPGHGIDGWRQLTGVGDRALSATALKPMGLSATELAAYAAAFARGGMDIIKDDHGLSDQATAPFDERAARCADAVGDTSLYLPNITAAWPEMMRRAEQAQGLGCRAVLVSPLLTGLDALAWLRDETGLAVMAHPSLTGGLLQPGHGLAPELLLGDIFRLAGADAVIYPNVGGRFGFTTAECLALNEHLRCDWAECRPAMPTPAGGMGLGEAGTWAAHYGADTILLIGGSLYADGDVETAARQLSAAIGGAI